MTDQTEHHRRLIRRYIQALESGVTGNELAQYFTPDAVQIEFPNRLNADGGRSDLSAILLRAEQGKKILTRQSFEILSETAEESRIAVEAIWTGTLAVPVGTLAPGAEMKAHFSMHFEIREGRIAVQRNYDCFDPW